MSRPCWNKICFVAFLSFAITTSVTCMNVKQHRAASVRTMWERVEAGRWCPKTVIRASHRASEISPKCLFVSSLRMLRSHKGFLTLCFWGGWANIFFFLYYTSLMQKHGGSCFHYIRLLFKRAKTKVSLFMYILFYPVSQQPRSNWVFF